MQRISCAIYVRKSTEKGLEMEFNSLHNQEESCKNYILSQTFNSWEYYKTYTDGGISGGTMKRPGLEDLLGDIRKGLIQTILVYKIDRFSRSIIDFYNMMKELEKCGCSFVSITQAFDTSTSMGKLTLNMLLSFAQFEREVSSERIRDKKAASKRKGFWMGGLPNLGYNIVEKQLVPNQKEAELVKLIFEKYLELGSITRVREYLEETGKTSKLWKTHTGTMRGGRKISSSMIARILRSKLYIGRIEDKMNGDSWPGRHKAIIGQKLFDQVQTLMDENRNQYAETYDREGYLLSNKVVDSDGNVFKNQKCSKNSKRKYRYYILKGKYLPAGDLDEITIQLVKDLLDSQLDTIIGEPRTMEFKAIDYAALTIREQANLIKAMVDKIVFHDSRLTFFFKIEDLAYLKPFQKENYLNTKTWKMGERSENFKPYASNDGRHLVIQKSICLNNRHLSNLYVGKGKKFISVTENSNNLIKTLAIGWRYGKLAREGMTLKDMRVSESRGNRSIYRYLSLNYLSPNIVNDIMDSRVPPHVNLQMLFDIASKYPDFNDQEKAFYNDR